MRKAHLWLVLQAARCIAASIKQVVNQYPSTIQYDDEMVVRINDTASSKVAVDEAIRTFALDVWDRSNGYADVRIKRTEYPLLLLAMNTDDDDKCRVQIPDLKVAIANTYPNLEHMDTSSLMNESFFSEYQPLENVQAWMDLLVQTYPKIVSKVTIGTSFEGREISGLHVGAKHKHERKRKAHARKHVIVNGAVHAREWISVAAVAFVANSLITNPQNKKEIRKMVKEVDWTFFPVVNVDGYKETWGSDRLWRKNRQPTGFDLCQGIDIDKSWDFKWQHGVDGNPCSETFSGREPFEAMESRALADYILKLKEDKHTNLVGYFDIHSYSQQSMCFAFTSLTNSTVPICLVLQKFTSRCGKS